jgi:hypothetical protein
LIDWKPVCSDAIRHAQYELVASDCKAAGIDENLLRAAFHDETARALIAKGEFAAALEELRLESELDPLRSLPFDVLCGQAAALERFKEVQTACEAQGFFMQQARWIFQMSQIDNLVNSEYALGQAVQQLAGYIRQEPDFEAYAAESTGLIGNLCVSVYLTNGDLSPIQSLCDTATYNDLPFPTYLLLEQVRVEISYGEGELAAKGLNQAFRQYQAKGAPSNQEFDNGMYQICYYAVQVNLTEQYRQSCEQAGVILDQLVLEAQDRAVYDTLDSFRRTGNYAAGADFLIRESKNVFTPRQKYVFDFCQAAIQDGQYSLVEQACSLYAYDPALLQMEYLLDEVNSLLQEQRIDDALLKLTKILQQFPAYQIPDDAWSNLCSAGVAAGQYYKVKDACMRVPQPEG